MTKKRLTIKQARFVEAMADPNTKSQKQAAIEAGCLPNSARVTASKWLTMPNILDAINERKNRAISHHLVTPEEVLGSAVFQMRSSIADLLDEDGSFSIEKAKATGAIDLLKKHKETVRVINHKDGSTETVKTVFIEILTNQDGRREVAEYIGMRQSGGTMIRNLQKERNDRFEALKHSIKKRASEKGVTYKEELKNYLDNYALPELKERFMYEFESL